MRLLVLYLSWCINSNITLNIRPHVGCVFHQYDSIYFKGQAKLDEHYSQTEQRLEAETKAKIKEMEAKSKEFSETVRKEIVNKFKFSKEQMDQFINDQIKQIKKMHGEAVARLEAQTQNYKKDSENKTDMVRQELINIMESRTTRYHKEIKGECESNMRKMSDLVAQLQGRIQTLEGAVSPFILFVVYWTFLVLQLTEETYDRLIKLPCNPIIHTENISLDSESNRYYSVKINRNSRTYVVCVFLCFNHVIFLLEIPISRWWSGRIKLD